MLVTLNEILADARKKRYAVPAFDISNYEMLRGVLDTCEEENSPAILMCLGVDMAGKGMRVLPAVIKAAALLYRVPVCLHLDHATDINFIMNAVDNGFTSVMYDGSILPFDQNALNTSRVVKFARSRGITVEAELGHVGNAVTGDSMIGNETSATVDDPEATLTDSAEVMRFIELTDTDALAVAIGTSHGVYKKTPTLRIDRLDEITTVCDRPLVLHGGSGTPRDQIKRAIEHGISKINIYSDVVSAMNAGLKAQYEKISNMSAWPEYVFAEARENMKRVIRGKIRDFGSDNRA